MSSASSTPTATTEAKTGRRFLLVDDSHDFVETLRLLLELNGHHVEVAFDGVAGLEAAVRMQPDVVVLDVGLPNSTGMKCAVALESNIWLHGPSSLARRAGHSLSTISWVSSLASTRT